MYGDLGGGGKPSIVGPNVISLCQLHLPQSNKHYRWKNNGGLFFKKKKSLIQDSNTLLVQFISGTVKSFAWAYRCCWALICLDTVDSQEHFSNSQLPSCWTWLGWWFHSCELGRSIVIFQQILYMCRYYLISSFSCQILCLDIYHLLNYIIWHIRFLNHFSFSPCFMLSILLMYLDNHFRYSLEDLSRFNTCFRKRIYILC